MSKNRNVVPLGTRHRATLRSKIESEKKHQRSREAVTRSRQTVRGRFPSQKMGRPVDWESQLERRACYRFEFSPAVIEFKEQPQPIRFPHGDLLAKYTPDFELTLCNGEIWFVEIKPLDHVRRPELRKRLSLASDWYERNGYQFIVITDEELIHPHLESNMVFLRHYLTHELGQSTADHGLSFVSQSIAPTLGGLHEYFGDKVTAYALLCRHLISIDFSRPFSSDSKIYLPKEASHATLLFSYRSAPDFRLS
jgi:hypothetical protein